MAIRSVGFALAVMLLLLVVVGAQNTDLVSSVCNTEVIPAGSPFYGTLGNLLSDLELNTALNSGYDYLASTAGSPSAYGEAICRQTLSDVECTNCLYALGNNILNICGNAIGAQVQFTDCSIRYEQYYF